LRLAGPFELQAIHPPVAKSRVFALRRSMRAVGAFGSSELHDQMGLHSDRRGILPRVCAQIPYGYAKWVVVDHEIVTGVRHVIGCARRLIDGVLYAGADLGVFIIRRTAL
jgi:hypothetical protein